MESHNDTQDFKKYTMYEKENPYNNESMNLQELVQQKLAAKYIKPSDNSYVHTNESNNDILKKSKSTTQIPLQSRNENFILNQANTDQAMTNLDTRNFNTEMIDTNDEIPLHLVQSKSASTTSKNSTKFNYIIDKNDNHKYVGSFTPQT